MSKHKCINFLEDGVCVKCRTPEWALFYPKLDHKVGDMVRLPLDYTDGGKTFQIISISNRGITIRKDEYDVQWYDWWELYPVEVKK